MRRTKRKTPWSCKMFRSVFFFFFRVTFTHFKRFQINQAMISSCLARVNKLRTSLHPSMMPTCTLSPNRIIVVRMFVFVS